MSLLKVLLICSEYPFGRPQRIGGGGSHVYYLSEALAETGKVEVFLLTYEGAEKPLDSHPNVHIYPCPFKGERDRAFKEAEQKALDICNKYKIDIVHGHHYDGLAVGSTVATALKKPFILTMHKPPTLSGHPAVPRYKTDADYAKWYKGAKDDRVSIHIAYSKTYIDELKRVKVHSDRIRFIYHGVPATLLRKKAINVFRELVKRKSKLPISSEETVILCPLRIEKPGVGTFIIAMWIINRKHLDKKLKFIITGKPHKGLRKNREKIEIFRSLVKDLGLHNSILFREFSLKEMWAVYRRSQVCVIPSTREGLGIAILEALAIGTPVVATDTTGSAEIIENGKSGLLFPVGDAVKLAENIISVLKDPDLTRRLKEEGMKRVEEKFNASQMAEEYIKLYSSLK